MSSKKAIILLHAQYETNIEALQEILLIWCKDKNLTVIKTIIVDDEHDYGVFESLINLINKHKGSINLIVPSNILNELFHIFTYTVIATLLEAKLINSLYIYQGKISQDAGAQGNGKTFTTKGEELLEIKNNLLPFCAEYYKAILTINSIETFYDDE